MEDAFGRLKGDTGSGFTGTSSNAVTLGKHAVSKPNSKTNRSSNHHSIAHTVRGVKRSSNMRAQNKLPSPNYNSMLATPEMFLAHNSTTTSNLKKDENLQPDNDFNSQPTSAMTACNVAVLNQPTAIQSEPPQQLVDLPSEQPENVLYTMVVDAENQVDHSFLPLGAGIARIVSVNINGYTSVLLEVEVKGKIVLHKPVDEIVQCIARSFTLSVDCGSAERPYLWKLRTHLEDDARSFEICLSRERTKIQSSRIPLESSAAETPSKMAEGPMFLSSALTTCQNHLRESHLQLGVSEHIDNLISFSDEEPRQVPLSNFTDDLLTLMDVDDPDQAANKSTEEPIVVEAVKVLADAQSNDVNKFQKPMNHFRGLATSKYAAAAGESTAQQPIGVKQPQLEAKKEHLQQFQTRTVYTAAQIMDLNPSSEQKIKFEFSALGTVLHTIRKGSNALVDRKAPAESNVPKNSIYGSQHTSKIPTGQAFPRSFQSSSRLENENPGLKHGQLGQESWKTMPATIPIAVNPPDSRLDDVNDGAPTLPKMGLSLLSNSRYAGKHVSDNFQEHVKLLGESDFSAGHASLPSKKFDPEAVEDLYNLRKRDCFDTCASRASEETAKWNIPRTSPGVPDLPVTMQSSASESNGLRRDGSVAKPRGLATSRFSSLNRPVTRTEMRTATSTSRSHPHDGGKTQISTTKLAESEVSSLGNRVNNGLSPTASRFAPTQPNSHPSQNSGEPVSASMIPCLTTVLIPSPFGGYQEVQGLLKVDPSSAQVYAPNPAGFVMDHPAFVWPTHPLPCGPTSTIPPSEVISSSQPPYKQVNNNLPPAVTSGSMTLASSQPNLRAGSPLSHIRQDNNSSTKGVRQEVQQRLYESLNRRKM